MQNQTTENFEKINILLVVEGDIVTTQLVERLLVYCARWGLEYRKVYLKDLKLKDFYGEVLPLFVRSADPLNVFFVECLLQAKKPYLYYLDDNFWALTGDSHIAQYYSNPSVRKTLDMIVHGAERVLVNTPVIADVVRKYNDNVDVLSAFFDFSIIENLIQEAHNEIRIGFAGSITRERDLEVVAPAVHRILEAYDNHVVFEFAGILPKGLIEGERIRFFPNNDNYEDFIRWQYTRGWDIALAPLAPVESNASKTNNKYREYGACRIAGVYSDYGPYITSVENGRTGLLCGWNEDEWYDSICSLIDNQALRNGIRSEAEKDVKDRFSLSTVSRHWFDLFSFTDTKIFDSKNIIYFTFYKKIIYRFISLSCRISNYYKINGFYATFNKSFEKILKYHKH